MSYKPHFCAKERVSKPKTHLGQTNQNCSKISDNLPGAAHLGVGAVRQTVVYSVFS